MGGSSSKSSKSGSRVVLLGLDASGKTSVLYGLKMGEQVITIPTIGPNVESMIVGNTEIQFWDVGGQERLRPLWKSYYDNIKGIIFVLDATDRNRINIAYVSHKIHETKHSQSLQIDPSTMFITL
eukprot:TRINITY_DN5631_c0_g1_i2.p1 TRINITY_DN5631_c0_g1~~TRINITY_DN5631_c0_g1_i2.p1  ORF type:complete len:125 (-),score=29.44 TRINITY_DN5631_c0_g1_i2:32-406(-)